MDVEITPPEPVTEDPEEPISVEPTPKVEFPDVNLAKKVREALNLPDGAAIPKAEIAALTEFYAPEASIGDLTGLEFAINLIWLDLDDNSISDLSPVSGLTNLTALNLYKNDISNISAISGLTKLTELVLAENNISDISAVSGFTNLTWLNLGENSISDVSPVSGLTNLTTLYLYNNDISNISAISGLTKLTDFELNGNNISNISPVSGLTNLAWLGLAGNSISDLSPLVSNMGLGEGDFVSVEVNPLSYASIHVSIPTLQGRGVEAVFFDRTPTALLKISGDRQTGKSGAELANPFVVEVRDSNNSAFEGVPVTYTVTQGGGTLSVTSTKTDANGRAESTLTLGPNPETNTVEVTATGIQVKQTFNAEGIRIPKTLEIIAGNDQEGPPGAALEKPFVVEVRDQAEKPLPDVEVSFSVSSGGGTLSVTSTTTNANGRAESRLTLGPNPGRNTVTVSVTGVQEQQTFTSEGIRTPKTLEIIAGDNQEGLPGAALENPFIAEVRDQSDKPLAGVQVTFSVSSGGGTLSVTSATTNSNGRAESILTLGPNAGTNTVTASVAGIEEVQTFRAEGIRIPLAFWIITGFDQKGVIGEALAKPLVVEVRDRSGEPLPSVQVIFSVSSGGGTLSVTTATTDNNGRAKSILTLGPNLGTNTVTVSVTGIKEKQTFTSEGIRTPKTLEIISGDNQEGLPGAALENPFIVEVRDQSDKPLPGIQVTFSVSSGGGTLSVTSTTTNANGRAESRLTLGPNPGRNTVTVSVTGVQEQQTFTSEGIRTPKTLEIISGDNQEGLPGAALENPFIVEVRDQSDKPLAGVQVTFSVTSGGGTLSATSVTTDASGRAESRLTLGPNPGTNTVSVSVAGIQAQETFNAEGIRIPFAFWIISGDKQQGLPGAALENPFIVEVRDQSDKPLAGVQVTFSVTSGGGTLSATSVTTDASGRAESRLTLGPNPGTNTVSVSVAGIKEKQTVSAFAELPPIPQDATLSLLPSPVQSPAVGEELTLSLNIAGGEGVAGYQATVQFDDTALRYVSSAIGDYLPAGAFPLPPDASSNTVTLGATSFGGESSGDGTLATITFEVIAVKESTLSLSDVLLSDSAGTGRLPRVEDGQITESPQLRGDVNGDGIVNILDLVLVAGRFGQSGQESADVNGDGIVNILDLVLVAGAFGNAAAPASDPQALAMLSATDVGQWLAHAQELDLTDATSQRGILFLEQVLAVLTPKETVLLPNYPNPFNPETWIPYRLANDTDVRISIYDINGALVRQLDLGYQRAGYYTDRSRAAYWDGRNAFGEPVASGIYFYSLTARDFSATRKMLIGK